MSVQGTEKRRIQQVVDTQGNTKIVHPETSADMVLFDNTTAQLDNAPANLQDAVEKVADLAKNGGVTGVKGNKETAYRKGNVNLTPENIGAEPTITTKGTAFNKNFGSAAGTVMEGNDSRVTTAVTDIAGLKTSVANAQNTADSAKAIAEGRARAVSFDTFADMQNSLKAATNTEYEVGDNLFIKATGVPDYWVSAVLSTNAGQYGYYEISILETQKVDLSGYQTKTDNGLNTTAKTVVGAINEVKGAADGAKSAADAAQGTADTAKQKAETNATAITDLTDDLKDGTIKVNSATNADNATSATSATTATKLSAKKTISLTGDVTGSVQTDFSTNPSIATTLKNSGVAAGSYSAVSVNAKGIVTAGGKSIEFGTSGQTTPSNDLMVGGLFFELV